MNDRELLEMAAKAAGIKALRDPHGILRDCTGLLPENNIFSAPYWNPLTDDGDAFRLAVFCAQLYGFYHFLRAWLRAMRTENGDPADPYAATRRAIVRAAAEIGRSQL